MTKLKNVRLFVLTSYFSFDIIANIENPGCHDIYNKTKFGTKYYGLTCDIKIFYIQVSSIHHDKADKYPHNQVYASFKV